MRVRGPGTSTGRLPLDARWRGLGPPTESPLLRSDLTLAVAHQVHTRGAKRAPPSRHCAPLDDARCPSITTHPDMSNS